MIIRENFINFLLASATWSLQCSHILATSSIFFTDSSQFYKQVIDFRQERKKWAQKLQIHKLKQVIATTTEN